MNEDMDNTIHKSLMAGLADTERLNDMKIMGAILKPLYQNEVRMINDQGQAVHKRAV